MASLRPQNFQSSLLRVTLVIINTWLLCMRPHKQNKPAKRYCSCIYSTYSRSNVTIRLFYKFRHFNHPRYHHLHHHQHKHNTAGISHSLPQTLVPDAWDLHFPGSTRTVSWQRQFFSLVSTPQHGGPVSLFVATAKTQGYFGSILAYLHTWQQFQCLCTSFNKIGDHSDLVV